VKLNGPVIAVAVPFSRVGWDTASGEHAASHPANTTPRWIIFMIRQASAATCTLLHYLTVYFNMARSVSRGNHRLSDPFTISG
jgi:hypothetical protein